MSCVRVGVVPKALGNSAFELARIGAEEAAAELGDVELIFDGPVRPTVQGQIATIGDLRARGVDVLAVNANDPRQLVPHLTAAEECGIPVTTWDAGVRPRNRHLHLCPASDEALAAIWLDQVRRAMPDDGGDFAILSTTEVAPNQNRWIDAIRQKLAAKEFNAMTLCETLYGGDLADLSRDKVNEAIVDCPNLKAVLGLTGLGLAAAAEAIEARDMVGRIFATGLGYPSEMKPYVDKGIVRSFAVWSMIDLGYAAAYVAYSLAKGEINLQIGQTIGIGRLGNRKVEVGLEVAVAEPCVYDASNVEAAALAF